MWGFTIHLGLLKNLYSVDEHLFKGVDRVGLLLHGVSDLTGDQLLDKSGDCALLDGLLDYIDHSSPDLLGLGFLGVGGLAGLSALAVGVADGEEAQDVPVLGLAVTVSLD